MHSSWVGVRCISSVGVSCSFYVLTVTSWGQCTSLYADLKDSFVCVGPRSLDVVFVVGEWYVTLKHNIYISEFRMRLSVYVLFCIWLRMSLHNLHFSQFSSRECVLPSVPLRLHQSLPGSAFQRRTFPLFWVPELSAWPSYQLLSNNSQRLNLGSFLTHSPTNSLRSTN
jgi:hypothetical protein